MWKIIKNDMGKGLVEYQVSDGDVGSRTVSYDFDNILDAENCLHDIETKEVKQNENNWFNKATPRNRRFKQTH